MFCDQCSINIPPAWKACIADNKCPACSGQIMNDQAVELMSELKKAMDLMPADPQGLAGWLLSNYKLQKIGDAQPTEFYGTKKQQEGTNNLKIADNPLQQFLKKSGVTTVDPKKQKHFKLLVEQINEDNGIEREENYEDPDYLPEAETEEDIQYTKTALNVMRSANKSNKYHQEENEFGEEKISSANLEEGLEELHSSLRPDRLKRLLIQKNLVEGGSAGKIRRS